MLNNGNTTQLNFVFRDAAADQWLHIGDNRLCPFKIRMLLHSDKFKFKSSKTSYADLEAVLELHTSDAAMGRTARPVFRCRVSVSTPCGHRIL
jgi:hypothetical protein